MASTPVTFAVEGDAIPPDDFGEAVREFIRFLSAIDAELSPGRNRSLQWRLTSLSYSSPALVGMVAEPRDDAPDIGPQVIAGGIAGINLIEREGVRPEEFNDDALDSLQRIAAFADGGITGLRVAAPEMHATAAITKLTAANIDVVFTHGYSLGSIEGHIEGLNIHGQPYFTVYDEVTDRAVRCYFKRPDLEKVLGATGSKVVVHGQVRRDPTGRPSQVRPVEFFERLGQSKGPVPAPGLAGVFRGLGDSRSYLEMIRGE